MIPGLNLTPYALLGTFVLPFQVFRSVFVHRDETGSRCAIEEYPSLAIPALPPQR